MIGFYAYEWIINKIFLILIILLVLYASTKFLNGIFFYWIEKREQKKLEKTSLNVIRRSLVILLWIIGLLIVLDLFGIEISPFLASLGIGGLAIALALQDTLSNYFAGIYITLDKTIRVGDYI